MVLDILCPCCIKALSHCMTLHQGISDLLICISIQEKHFDLGEFNATMMKTIMTTIIYWKETFNAIYIILLTRTDAFTHYFMLNKIALISYWHQLDVTLVLLIQCQNILRGYTPSNVLLFIIAFPHIMSTFNCISFFHKFKGTTRDLSDIFLPLGMNPFCTIKYCDRSITNPWSFTLHVHGLMVYHGQYNTLLWGE